MADNTLNFETRVDLSGLNEGAAAATAVLGKLGDNTKTVMTSAAEATNRLADAQRQLGAAAAQGNEAAAAIIAEYQAAVDAATASVGTLSAAEAKETTALRGSMSARMAASAEIRVLEGNMMGATRAAGAFLTMIPGVGAALQSAFAVFGAVALLEVLVQIGEAFATAFDLGGERARAMDTEIANVTLDIRRSTDELELQIQKLAQEQAKLEKKPFNGTQLVLDEAAVAADRLSERLEHVYEQELKVVKAMGGSVPERALGLTVNTHDEQVMLEEHKKYMAQSVSTQQQYNETQSFSNALQSHLNELKAEQAQADKNELESGVASGINLASKIRSTEFLLNQQKSEQKNIQTTMDLEHQEAATQKARDEHVPKGPSVSTDTSQLKVIEEQFSELQEKTIQLRGTGLTAGEAAAYWKPFLEEFRVDAQQYRALIDEASNYAPHSAMSDKLLLEARKLEGANAAYKKVLDEVGKETEDIHKLLFTEMVKVDPSAALKVASSPAERDTALKEIKKQAEEATKALLETTKAMQGLPKMVAQYDTLPKAQTQHDTNLTAIDTQHEQAQTAEATSLIPNKQEQLNELKAFHEQVLAEDERFIKQEIEIAKASGELQNAERLQQQLLAVQRKGDMQRLDDQRKIDQQMVTSQQQALNKMETDIAKLFATAITTQTSWAQASARLFQQVANQFITNLVKMAEQEVIAALEHKALLKQGIIADADSAAAKAFNWASSWGGPIAGAVAAAAAFAGVMAFDSFEAGGVVNGPSGSPVPIMAHAGERVLSKSQTDMFHQVVNNQQGGNAGAVHLHYNPTVSAYDKSGVENSLKDHASVIHQIVRQGYKSGALKP
jgi:hypothetical protein